MLYELKFISYRMWSFYISRIIQIIATEIIINSQKTNNKSPLELIMKYFWKHDCAQQ